MKTAGFDARAIANHLLDVGDQRGVTLSNLHLQKVVFFSHGEFLTKTGLDLVINRFEAWEHGPVVPELYHALKEFDDKAITGRAKYYDFVTRTHIEVRDDFSQSTQRFLEEMLMFYGRMNAWDLVRLSHAPDGAWSITVERSLSSANFGMIIDPMVIRHCFRGQAKAIANH